MSGVATGGKRKEENRHISFDMSGSSVSVVKTADMDENLEKRNQRRNKLFRRIQMDIKAKCSRVSSYPTLTTSFVSGSRATKKEDGKREDGEVR